MKKISLQLGLGLTTLIFVCSALGIKSVSAGRHTAQTTDDQLIDLTPENLEKFLDEFLPDKMENAHVPGLVITVVRGSEVILSKGYGFADLEKQTPMTPAINIRAGSVSKSVLSTGVIRMVELGILDLEAPVTRYISDLDLVDEFGPASTIGQLLTHTSGYQDTLVRSHSPDLESAESLGDVLKADLPPRVFAPGLVSSYSDWNFSLLGYAMEGATGKPYQEVMEELLFTPSGMDNTTYTQPLPDNISNNLATGYGWNYAKFRLDIVPHDYVRMSPGIALVTNGEDMGAYLQMLLNGGLVDGKEILSDESLGKLLTRQGSAHDLSRGWSYGFIENTISGRKVFYKDGNGIGFASRVVLMPDQDLGIFVSTNHRNLGEGLWPTEAAMMATRTLVSAIMENFVPESMIEVVDLQPRINSRDRLTHFTGQYQKAGISRNDFFKLEGLLDNVDVNDNGDGTLQIGSGTYQEVDTLVFQNLENPNFHVIFVENLQGEVEFLTFGGTGSYQKVSWFQAKNVQIGLLVSCALISLSMVIIWAINRKSHWLAFLSGLLNLLFIFGVSMIFISRITDMLVFFKTIPLSIQILFSIPWMIAASGTLSLGLLLKEWKKEESGWWVKVHTILVAIASAVMVWQANFWNLILR